MIHRLLIDLKSIKKFKGNAFSKCLWTFTYDFTYDMTSTKFECELRLCEPVFLWTTALRMTASIEYLKNTAQSKRTLKISMN